MKRTLKGIDGKEVNVLEMVDLIARTYKKGNVSTIYNKDWTFYAEVEHTSKRKNVYTFTSTTYGHKFVIDFNNNTAVIVD